MELAREDPYRLLLQKFNGKTFEHVNGLSPVQSHFERPKIGSCIPRSYCEVHHLSNKARHSEEISVVLGFNSHFRLSNIALRMSAARYLRLCPKLWAKHCPLCFVRRMFRNHTSFGEADQ